MKKLKSFLAPLAVLLLIWGGVAFISCSSDDGDKDEPAAPTETPKDDETTGGETTGKTLYLVGADPIGWAVNESYKMTRKGNVYTIEVNSLPSDWKIWDGTWDYSFGKGNDEPTADGTEVEVWFDAANITMSSDTKVKITLTVVEGSDEKNSSIPSKIKIEKVN